MTKLASEWVDNRPFAPREIENNANAKFWRENKEYYGIFEKDLLPCGLPPELLVTTKIKSGRQK